MSKPDIIQCVRIEGFPLTGCKTGTSHLATTHGRTPALALTVDGHPVHLPPSGWLWVANSFAQQHKICSYAVNTTFRLLYPLRRLWQEGTQKV